ncbi:hypothetical protein, partial [Brevundimonas sp.]|uniref:hypothetical protein n=1 Tax=Brevundimonas sp. TaxID=1871086 RepID=UPI00391C2E8F
YELVPHPELATDPARPLGSRSAVRKKLAMLEQLQDVEVASRIVLGALRRQGTVNPLDYMYRALGVRMREVEGAAEEDAAALAALRLLGMHSMLDRAGVVTAARAAHEEQEAGRGEAAAARGEALLAGLWAHFGRLFAADKPQAPAVAAATAAATAATPASAATSAAMATHSAGLLGSAAQEVGLAALSVFGGFGLFRKGATSATSASSELPMTVAAAAKARPAAAPFASATAPDVRPAVSAREMHAELMRLNWVPVLSAPPSP